jgi:hypothetical protein
MIALVMGRGCMMDLNESHAIATSNARCTIVFAQDPATWAAMAASFEAYFF